MTCVAAAGAPVLTVRDWYFEKDNQPIYLAGYSPKAGIDGGRRPVGRVQEVGSRINYMRTWLELWNREDFMRPFVLVNGRADLSQYNAPFFDRLRAALDGSVKVGVVQELTLFNPWGARYDWEHHWWNPRNNIQHQPVDHTSLYTLGNPCQGLQERWVDKVLETVDASSARNFVIIEIDNELGTGGGPWREHFVRYVRARGDYPVSTIADYCGDYDVVAGPNTVICRHRGGNSDPRSYYEKIVAYNGAKPVIFNELYVWRDHSREVQRTVLWAIFMGHGMFCTDHWGGGKTTETETLNDTRVLCDFANSIPFHRYARDDSWLISSPGQSFGQSCEDPAGYLAYIWERCSDPCILDIQSGRYQLRWINPSNGNALLDRHLTAQGGPTTVTVPDFAHDAVLQLQRILE